MPKGVICGGAVDGSNQLGAIVTCQAMTACPDGAGPAAGDGAAANTRVAVTSKAMNDGRRRSGKVMGPSLDQFGEKRLRLFQISGIEALCEPAVNQIGRASC